MAELTFTVTEDDTALALGSGSLPVLGTPRLLAWCEQATCAALADDLTADETSVGTRVDLEHLAASPLDQQVQVTARVIHTDGRLRRLSVSARHVAEGRPGRLVGSGEITRIIVTSEKFLARITS